MLLFSSILFVAYFAKLFYPNWNFKNRTLIVSSQIILLFSAFVLLFLFLIFFTRNKYLSNLHIIVLIPLFLVFSYLIANPIDTYTLPKDVQVITYYANGTKQVTRTYKNAKSGHIIIDTVIVKDVWLFRKIYR